MKKLFKTIFLCLSLMFVICLNINVSANSSFSDGIYTTSYTIGGQSSIGISMIQKYFDSTAKIEVQSDNYYLTIKTLSSSLENLNLNLNDKMNVGEEIVEETSSITSYTYTLTYENLESELPFSVYVSVRGETFNFTLKVDLDNLTLTDETIDYTIEHKALFEPIININVGSSYELKQNSKFLIPEATASLGDEELEVTSYAYYLNGDYKENVSITNSYISLDNIGTYHLVFKASSSLYKTNLGNDTYVIYDIKIISSALGSDIAYYIDSNDILDDDVTLLVSKITNDTVIYQNISSLISNISENYEVYSISFVSSSGESITLDNDIEYYVMASTYYNRQNVKVYYYSNDELVEVSSTGYGRYVKFVSDNIGIFVICVPGVTFHMPIWGYILIVIASVVLLGLIIFLIIFFIRKHKKNNIDEIKEV